MNLNYVLKIIRMAFGIIMLVLGIIGLFVPILQGILFIMFGLMLMGVKKSQIKKWIKKFKKQRILMKQKQSKGKVR